MPLYERFIDEGRWYVEFIWLHLFGEPLLNPKIYSMIDLAEEAGINATRLTEQASYALLKSRLSLLILCLDSRAGAVPAGVDSGSIRHGIYQTLQRLGKSGPGAGDVRH